MSDLLSQEELDALMNVTQQAAYRRRGSFDQRSQPRWRWSGVWLVLFALCFIVLGILLDEAWQHRPSQRDQNHAGKMILSAWPYLSKFVQQEIVAASRNGKPPVKRIAVAE